MRHHSIYCAGSFIDTGNNIDVLNPYDGSMVGTTSLAREQDLEDAISKAVRSREPLRELGTWERSAILNQVADTLEANQETHARILAAEAGKPMRYAIGEIARAVQTFRVAAEETKRWPKEIIDIDWTPAGKGKRGYVRHFPVGPVAGIAPFNFPLNLAVHKIAPAIAAACPIILKPATSTPLSTLLLAEIISKTILPEGAVSILPMERAMGMKLVTDERIKLLSFTGSPEVGWQLKDKAGKKKVVLELGGNAGVIVAASANIEQAVTKCLTGAFAYSGQVCIHTQRIYIEEAIFDEFKDLFLARTKQLTVGDPLNPETEISSMIDESNAKRVVSWVNEAQSGGAQVLSGGSRDGAFVEPTIITGTRPEMRVCADEVFGPVVAIEPYSSVDDAICEVNTGRFGLQAGIFTDSARELELAWKKLEVGGVVHNDVPTFRVDHMPYGGIKDSGLGREGVRYAMTEMLEPRILVSGT